MPNADSGARTIAPRRPNGDARKIQFGAGPQSHRGMSVKWK
jgi:hypothetical protein